MTKYDSDLKKEIVEFAKEQGVDEIRVASESTLTDKSFFWDSIPELHAPSDILPGATNVIVLATADAHHGPHHIMDSYRTHYYVDEQFLTSGPSQAGALEVDFRRNFRALMGVGSITAYRVAKLLVNRGYSALNFPPEYARDFRTFLSLFSIKHVAVAAGIGTFGLSSLVLSPKFGPRIFLCAVLSDAPLEPDSPLKSDVCTKCMACVKICPSRAIELPENPKALNAYKHDHFKCYVSFGSLTHDHYLAVPGVPGRGCGECQRICPVGKKYVSKVIPKPRKIGQ